MTQKNSNPPMQSSPYALLVEGPSDMHAIIHLLARHGYDWFLRLFPREEIRTNTASI